MPTALITQRLESRNSGQPVDVLEHNYLDYFSKYFSRITPLNNHPSVFREPLECDVLIISGGGDLPNRFWNSARLSDEEDRLAEKRYDIQARLLKSALQDGKKIIAICFGMQLVNVFLGGEVTWNIHDQAPDRRPRMDHTIRVTARCPFASKAELRRVNSYHHQGIRANQLHDDLNAWAMDADYDVVEAASHRTHPLLCLEWHPERQSPDTDFNQHILERFLAVQS